MPAYLRALELGADAIELDVHATRDGVVVVHHDPSFHAGRVPWMGKRAIDDLDFAEVREFMLADGIRVPSLGEVLEAVGDAAFVHVEIKATNIEPLVVRCIRESTTPCAVHSFDHRVVQNVKKIFPAIRTGILETARHVDPTASLVATGANDLWQEVGSIDEDLVARTHAAGARVVAWTSNDPAQWKTLSEMRVDAICTDRIGDLASFSY
ncbi:MAG: glycerophosphodiester phosphodiesterase [Gemmatimonadaceae bacterium]